MTDADLQRRVAAGEPEAQFTQARLLDRAGRHEEALGLLDAAAAGGHVMAGTLLGARLLVGRAAPFEPAHGAALLAEAAKRGGGEAASLSAVAAGTGVGAAQHWPTALEWLQVAAERGHPGAGAQLALLAGDARLQAKAQSGAAPSSGVWARTRKAVDLPWWTTAPAGTTAFSSPVIETYPGFAPEAVCDWLIAKSRDRLARAAVKNAEAGGAGVDSMRTNTGVGFGLLDSDLVLLLLRARIAAATGLPMADQEPPNLLHYDVDQRYEPHYDFVNPEVPHFAGELARQGQRVATFLIYLNDDFEGGETDFPELGWRFKGRRGDGLLFRNVDAAGEPEPRTLHAGLPPTCGEKWLLSQWIRSRPQPPV